ncbi:unnamed protein product [Parajaminaea phylloscopi]
MVQISTLLTLGAATLAAAAPATKRAGPGQQDIDTTILNYALTLEHLEDAFYASSLAKLSAEDFKKAGFGPWIRERFVEIGGHEKSHVQFLTKALGDKAVKACTYDFGVTDVKSFIATSQLLEGVGVSAYLGAAQNITNPAYLTAAGSILTTEARHAAWVQSSAALSDPAGAAYDVPLTSFSSVYSLAAPLIKSCPSTNAKLPVKAFPALTLSKSSNIQPGQSLKVSGKGVSDGQYLAAVTAGSTLFAKIQNGKATVPKISTGRTYFLVTKGQSVTDDSIVAGPVASDYLLGAAEAAAAAPK